jgi:hypothetical protein
VLAAPRNDRCDDEAGARAVIVEEPEHRGRLEPETDLFSELAQRRDLGRLAGVDPAAGERPLARVSAQGGRTPGQEKAGASFFVGQHHDRHGGGSATVRSDRLARESGEILFDPGSERLVESAGEGYRQIIQAPSSARARARS